MGFSNWICSNSSKNILLKIVHPGGHVELHDRPILAAEIIYRNPRCVVAHPHVFQQPWAIVAPETVLMLGQKFYVVPVTTIRKLQRQSTKYSPNSLTPTSHSQKSEEQEDPLDTDSTSSSTCWFLMNSRAVKKDMDEDRSCLSDKTCFTCMITGVKKSSNVNDDDDDDSKEETRSASNFISLDDDGQQRIRGFTWKRLSRRHAKTSPKRQALEHWQPSLASITESEE